MKTCLTIVIVLRFFCVSAQENSDTIWLRPVEISAPSDDSLFMMPVSAKLIPADENLPVENVLARYTPVFFKTYSPGGVATVSHRGFGASQTLMVWNGFALNQLTLGQPSFSGMQSGGNVRFGIVSGTLAAADFSGGLSSYVYFDDVFYSDTANERQFLFSGGSFGTRAASFFADYRIKKSKISFDLYSVSSDNNYTFHNNAAGAIINEWPLQNRVAASFFNTSIKSNFMMPLKKGDFRLSFWAGSQFNESPASLLSPQLSDNESQTNRFIRLSGFLPIISTRNAGLQMRFFFSADTFLYVNKQLAISDGTATQSFAMRWNGFIRTSGGHEFSAEYYPGFNRVASANFDNIVFCTDQRLRLKYQLNRTEVFKISFWNHFLNRDFENVFLLPGASVGFIPRNMSSKAGQRLKWLSVYAGLARNMRMPTMNDLYWAPGGNPDLKPEDAWMADMTVFASFAENKRFKWDVKWMPYYSTTTNLIRWTPDSLSSQWNASNVAESRQYGFEATATATFQWSKNSLSGSLNVARVFAEDVSGTEIKTLIYVPDKTMNAVLSIRHGIWSGGYEFHYTGKRFTDGDNDRYMPEIFLHDVFVCVSRNLGSNKLSLSARLNNFMNADYQYIAWYPMPRRNFYVTLKWNWNE